MANIQDLRKRTTGYRGERPWRARYRDAAGREHARHFARKADAQRWLDQVAADLMRGAWVDPSRGRMRFADVAKAWLDSNPNKRATTYDRDATVIRVHLDPVIGSTPIGQIRPSHVRAVVARMEERLAPKTIQTNYGVLRAIFSWAVEDDLIVRSPCRGVHLPDVRKGRKPVASMTDVLRLADVIHADYRATVFLGALGLRQAEVFGLRIGAIDFLRRTVSIEATINEVGGRFVDGEGKTEASERTIAIPRAFLDEVAAHLARVQRHAPEELVFQAPEGGPVRATNFRTRVYNPAIKTAGLPGLTFHRLRHSAGHIMRELGVPLEVIQKRLGHRSIGTTADVYGSLPESIDRAVAEQLDGAYNEALSDVKPGTWSPVTS